MVQVVQCLEGAIRYGRVHPLQTTHTHTVLSSGTPAGLFTDSMWYSHTVLSGGTLVGLPTNSGMWYRWYSV